MILKQNGAILAELDVLFTFRTKNGKSIGKSVSEMCDCDWVTFKVSAMF